ncbi:hypothetical protein ACFSC4_25465 [Deinococcus malanensis]|uniref:hypothetical protein n=1 Tax=Deinococcus malanensis TaxID=1706855 RepID=UPI00362BDE58
MTDHLHALPEELRGAHHQTLQRHATMLNVPVASWLTGVAVGVHAHWLGGLGLGYPVLWMVDGAVGPWDAWLVPPTVAVMIAVVWGHARYVHAQLPRDLTRLGLQSSSGIAARICQR